MTTPERLRRRQRLESLGIAILAAALVMVFVYFRGQDDAQESCFNNYFAQQAKTSKIRGAIVEQESNATRRVIRKALTAKTIEDIVKAREVYLRSLQQVDEARQANPIPPFPEEVCG